MNGPRGEAAGASFAVDRSGSFGARRWALAQVQGWDPSFRERLESVVGELVANALEHGAPPVTVWLQTLPAEAGCRVTVLDRGAGPAADGARRRRTAGVEAERGRGLQLVEDLADEVAATNDAVGYRVVAELLTGKARPAAGWPRVP